MNLPSKITIKVSTEQLILINFLYADLSQKPTGTVLEKMVHSLFEQVNEKVCQKLLKKQPKQVKLNLTYAQAAALYIALAQTDIYPWALSEKNNLRDLIKQIDWLL